MNNHQDRVRAERAELTEKLHKLSKFLHGPNSAGLDRDERQRMFRQLKIMDDYALILAERILHFPQI